MDTRILETRILMMTDLEAIMDFEKTRLAATIPDAMDREMRAWTARWRKEALEHYLPQGWSFGVFEAGKLKGYFIGQPYIFHRGLTQTLWIEHLSAETNEIARSLMETAHKWSRDKHFQTVLLENSEASTFVLELFPKATLERGGLIELRSARF